MEDLPIQDVTNTNEWILIIAVRDGVNTKIYRKVYDLSHQSKLAEAPQQTRRDSGETNE